MSKKLEDYEVTTARSGHEALLHLAETIPDLIISDIRMPGMDGYKLARQLRGSPRTALVPIVFLTAKDETTIVSRVSVPGSMLTLQNRSSLMN